MSADSNVLMSLVNVSLKFKTQILKINCYFLLEKCENLLHQQKMQKILTFFQQKINSLFAKVVGI